MTTQVKNPFIVSGYQSPSLFCDRESETKQLIGALTNGRNIALISPRRMGKSGLIHHCFYQPQIRRRYHTVFIDIYATGSLKELVYLMGKQIFETLKPRGRKIIDHFFSAISSLRPAFKIDPMSGNPTFDIGLGEIHQPEHSLEQIISYLEMADKPCLVAIDEFQQILKYPEKNVEALLRTHIQQCHNVHFIFSGSQHHMMQSIFFSASRPFYQSVDVLGLQAIPLAAYLPFVQKHFKQGSRQISDECITRIYTLFEGHTWYMQTVFNRLYEQLDPGEAISLPLADKILHHTVESFRVIFQGMLTMLPEKQKELLIAISKEGTATGIVSASFLRRHSLPSSSSVQAALRPLLEKEFVTGNRHAYQVYDRFLGLWLKENYGTGYTL